MRKRKGYREYLVEWKIQVIAKDPVDAAKTIREIQLDKANIATIYEVTEIGARKRKVIVDLWPTSATEEKEVPRV